MVLRHVEMAEFLIDAALDLNKNEFKNNMVFLRKYNNLQHGLILSLTSPDSKDIDVEKIIDEAERRLKESQSKLTHKIEEIENTSKIQ